MRRILTLAFFVFSLTACAVPALAQAPTAVEAHTNGSRQIEVTWSAVANATDYNVYAGTTQGGPYALQSGNPTTQTHKYVNTVSDAAITYVVVTAVVGSTESAYSPEASCASGSARLAAPQNVTATATGGQVALTWNSVPGAASYDLYRTPTDPSSDSGIYLIQVTGTGYTDAKLTNGTTYTYQVAGVTTTGTGNLSGPVRATPLAPPSLTAIVEATANQSGTEIDLAWTASAGATSYVLYRGTSSGAEVAYPPATSATTFSDTNLSTNTTYYYQVKAIAQNGQSAKSAEVSATTGATLLPAPTLTATARDAQVVLTWTTVAGAQYYDLYRLPNTDKSGLYLRMQGGDYQLAHGQGRHRRHDLHLLDRGGSGERAGHAFQPGDGHAYRADDFDGHAGLVVGDRPKLDGLGGGDGLPHRPQPDQRRGGVDDADGRDGHELCRHGLDGGHGLLLPGDRRQRHRRVRPEQRGACGDVPSGGATDGASGESAGGAVVACSGGERGRLQPLSGDELRRRGEQCVCDGGDHDAVHGYGRHQRDGVLLSADGGERRGREREV